ncbi:28 kDa ribonucleoprotein, chloroplastic [Hordeum vulgare]|nr:28 kDa ribonucleoprotein, chloroplastic [Hordeum vulgare]
MPATHCWSDLPPDLAREISGRLHDPADFVRFHAVCRPWRDPWSPTATTTTARFLPWLLAAVNHQDSTRFEMRCVLSKSNYRSQPLLSDPCRQWVTSSSGTGLRCLTIQDLRPSLHDLLTGGMAHLPPLPGGRGLGLWEKQIKPLGVIYPDGTTLLYSMSYLGGMLLESRAGFRFTAAILRPGDAEWTIVQRTLECTTWSRCSNDACVAYHGGKILVIMKAGIWRVVTPQADEPSDVLVIVKSQGKQVVQLSSNEESTCNYILESRGEILWVSIQIRENNRYQAVPHACHLNVTVSVQALEEPSSPELEKIRWVRRDGRCLADRVMFLGSRHSFVVDAGWEPNGHGGCAYFLCHTNGDCSYGYGNRAVFRCNLIDGKTQLVQRLPPCWHNKMCTWFNPESIITPPQVPHFL